MKMENIGYGLLLMVVGMSTVFLILGLVIGIGKGLIRWVNRYAPEAVVIRPTPSPVAGNRTSTPDQTVAAIVSAVNAVTGGKGKVTSIDSL